jgi:CheY-like chemotaxis protein
MSTQLSDRDTEAIAGQESDPIAKTPNVAVNAAEKTGMRVFIVDDNEDSAMLMAEALEARGHVTATSFDAATTLKFVSGFSPDVILLDIGLPIVNGYELAQKLRQMPELGAARLFAVTGYSRESSRKRAMECGFDQHITKPIELEALDSLIRRKAEPA